MNNSIPVENDPRKKRMLPARNIIPDIRSLYNIAL
jgi:hypothetical protein